MTELVFDNFVIIYAMYNKMEFFAVSLAEAW